MTDTPYKQAPLGQNIEQPESLALSSPSSLRRPPVVAQARAQNSILAGRRVLLSRHMGGSTSWLADNSATGGASQAHPEPGIWRETWRARVEQQAGTELEVRVLSAPSGQTEVEVPGLGIWEGQGVGGDTRVVVGWENTAADTASEDVEFTLGQAQDPGGVEDPEVGSAWARLLHSYRLAVRPAAAFNSQAEASKWSEWPTLDLEVSDRGGARVVHMSVCEAPADHVVDDAELEVTVNGYDPAKIWAVKVPQTEQDDGATYEEHRFGVLRAMYAAERQTQRVGPRLLSWSPYTEAKTSVSATEPNARSFNSATPARVSVGSNTAWDPEAPGFDIMGTGKAPENLATRITGASAIPVRVRIYARWSILLAPSTAVFRVESSARSFVQLELDSAVVGTSYGWHETTGWLEAPVASDDLYPVVQEFIEVNGGTVQIRYFDVTAGEYPVA
jgi:hypothetical protein